MRDTINEAVLLIHCARVDKSLAVHFQSPSASKPPHSLGATTAVALPADSPIMGTY